MCYLYHVTDMDFVAPLVGAWIEIYDKLSDGIIELVAPLVGAWIEIRRTLYCL